MKHIQSRLAAFALLPVVAVLAGVIVFSSPVLAADCGGIQTAVVDCASAKDTTGSPVVAILVLAIQVLTGAIGVVAIGALVYAGIMYSSASGNAGQVTKAKELIRNTVIGLVLFALMGLLLNFLIPGGLFSGSTKFGAGGNGLGSIKASPIQQRKLIVEGEKDDGSSDSGSVTLTAGRCYEVKVSKSDIATKDRFHVSGSQPYALENSFEGIDYAKKHGYKAIDIDIMVTKDNVLVGSHAWEPLKSGKMGGFKDTAGKITDKKRRISEMTLAEVRRLKHKDGYRISTLEELIAHAAKKDMNLIIEMKVPKKIEKQMPQIAAWLNKYNVKAGITSRKDKAGYVQALATARSLGFHTRMASSPGATAKDRTWVSPKKDTALCNRLKGN